MIYSIVLSIHVVVCVLVILVVLLQSGKGAGFAGLMGGGGGDALFSAPWGSSFIRNVTTGFAVAFFTTSLLLTFYAARRGTRSVTQNLVLPPVAAPTAPEAAPAPATPAPASTKK